MTVPKKTREQQVRQEIKKEEERIRTVRLTAGALLTIVLLSVAVVATIVTVETRSPILTAMLDGAIMTISFAVICIFAPGVLRGLSGLVSGAYLLRLGIVIAWTVTCITSGLRLGEGVTGAGIIPFSTPLRGYLLLLMMIAGVLHVSAIGMMEGKPHWRNVWIAVWALVAGGGLTGLVAWIDVISEIYPTPYVITGMYNPYLVSLSIAVAIVGSYIALDIMQRGFGVTGFRKVSFLCSAGLVMGSSIWSMHFLGMMAFSLPGFYMYYDSWLTVLSFLLPVAVTTMGFLSVSFGVLEKTILQTMGSGLLVALGIVGMHYTGMAAMEVVGVGLTYSYKWVAISIIIAVVASVVALWLAFTETTRTQRMIAAVVLGAFGIAGLHYSAMVGAIFFRVVE